MKRPSILKAARKFKALGRRTPNRLDELHGRLNQSVASFQPRLERIQPDGAFCDDCAEDGDLDCGNGWCLGYQRYLEP